MKYSTFQVITANVYNRVDFFMGRNMVKRKQSSNIGKPNTFVVVYNCLNSKQDIFNSLRNSEKFLNPQVRVLI